MDIENYKAPKIIALEIDEFDEDSGVDAIALVEQPAIEADWIYFSSNKQIFQSYNDYPQEASDNACKVLRWIDEHGRDEVAGMTQTGLARANQLCNRENISEETIARMSAFARHKQNAEIDEEYKGTPWKDKGYVAWLGWGGTAGIEWAQRKLKQIRKEEQSEDFNLEENLQFYFELVDYLDGIPLFTTKEEAQEAADMFGCDGIHEHQIGGFTFYMPCSEHDTAIQKFLEEVEEVILEKKKKYINDLPSDVQDKILEYLDEVGETEEGLEKEGWVLMDDEQKFAISSKPNEPSIQDYGVLPNGDVAVKIRYKYVGPRDSKNRTFCKRLLDKNLLFRKEDINNMTISGENSQFGIYDIFTYKGSYGCRHSWQIVRMRKNVDGSEVTTFEDSVDASSSVNPLPTMNRNPNSTTLINKDAEQSAFSKINFENEKQLIAGPLMIPRKLIYRYDEKNGEYYVYFTESTIEKIAYKYLMNKYQENTNLEHSEAIPLKDVVLVESWLVQEPEKDKSYALTGEKYEKGTWFGIMKVKNSSVWEEWVKTGRVKGFSVEGFFADRMINASKHRFYYRTTEGGTEIVIDHETLVVFILKDGERSAILPDGTYELDNGKKLQVVGSKAIEGSF
jgi:hypothetical protein